MFPPSVQTWYVMLKSSVQVKNIARNEEDRLNWTSRWKHWVKSFTNKSKVNQASVLLFTVCSTESPTLLQQSIMSTATCVAASWRTWSNPRRVCSSASSSGPVTGQWAATWWRWSSPWLHTAAPSSPSSSHSERRPQDQLGRGTPAAGMRVKTQAPGLETWVFLQRLRPAGPERSGGGPLPPLPSWAGPLQLQLLLLLLLVEWRGRWEQQEEESSAHLAWTLFWGPACGPHGDHHWTGHHHPETLALWWWLTPSDAPLESDHKSYFS